MSIGSYKFEKDCQMILTPRPIENYWLKIKKKNYNLFSSSFILKKQTRLKIQNLSTQALHFYKRTFSYKPSHFALLQDIIAVFGPLHLHIIHTHTHRAGILIKIDLHPYINFGRTDIFTINLLKREI